MKNECTYVAIDLYLAKWEVYVICGLNRNQQSSQLSFDFIYCVKICLFWGAEFSICLEVLEEAV